MIIGWLQKLTLIDYPNKTACIVFTTGCNLRCRFCHNPELVLPEKFNKQTIVSTSDFFSFLDTRINLLDGVVISGGEPTIHKDLVTFCETIKKKWFFIKLDTNGRDPYILHYLVSQRLIDYVAMDIKTNAKHWWDLTQNNENYANYKKTIDYVLQWNIEYEFRTTIIKNHHTEEIFTDMMQDIIGAKKYYLQNYRPDKILDSWFDGDSFTIEDIKKFQKIAQKYVEQCNVR